jgi:general stress protein 26
MAIPAAESMNESAEDMARLQSLLHQSATKAGPHLRRTFEIPEHALTSKQLVRYWGAGKVFALATVTPRGEPRVAPVGVLFDRGRPYVPTATDSAHVRHIAKNSSVSLTHWVSNFVAIIVHGHATLVPRDGPEFATLVAVLSEKWWQDLNRDRHGAFLRVEPDVIYTWAHEPSSFTEI